jgi:hypothetical protein
MIEREVAVLSKRKEKWHTSVRDPLSPRERNEGKKGERGKEGGREGGRKEGKGEYLIQD